MKTQCRNRITLGIGCLLCPILVNCGGSGGGTIANDSVFDASLIYSVWPNETTSENSSNDVVSKVLVSDLDSDGKQENIFISAVQRSTDKKSSILRVTQGQRFVEVSNFKSDRSHLLKDAIPFGFDIDSNSVRELFFVSYDRDKLYAFEFKNKNLKNLKMRWALSFTDPLPADFDRQMKLGFYKDVAVIKLGEYAIYEPKARKPKLVDLTKVSARFRKRFLASIEDSRSVSQ